MTVDNVINLLTFLAVAFGIVKLASIQTLLERIASTTHYPQMNAFNPSVKTPKVKRADKTEKAGHAPTDGLVDITDLPEEDAIKAIENWKP